jgi:hypothetical protein
VPLDAHDFSTDVWAFVSVPIWIRFGHVGSGRAITAKELLSQLPLRRLIVWDDWHWGYVNGKLATLRWMHGMEWDFLDT